MEFSGIPKSVPKFESLESKFKRMQIVNIILLVIIIISSLYFIWKIFISIQDSHLINRTIITMVILFILFIFFVTKPLTKRAKVLLQNSNENHIGNYSKDELLEIVKEILKPYHLKEIPKIYIFGSREADVTTMNSLFLNFIKPLNAIFISSMIFQLLNKKELKAIMGHELGHFYRYQLPLERAIELSYLFIGLFSIYIYILIGIFHIWIWLLIIVFVYFGINLIIAFLTMKYENTLEYLADYYAAKRFGKLNMINGLMTVVKSTEITEYLYKNILKKLKKSNHLSHLDYNTIVEIVMNKLPNQLVSRQILNKFISDTFNSNEIEELKKDPNSIDKKAKTRFIHDSLRIYNSHKRFKIIDWDLFDFHKKDFKIDEVEYPHLIKTLIERPEEQMYDLIYDNVQSVKKNSHPTMRERILFLEKNLPEEN